MIREDRFCVYIHRLQGSNKVILVGHGTEIRARSKQGRNKAWNDITKDNPWYYTLIKRNMLKQDAADLEVKLINIYKACGNSKTTSTEPQKLDTVDIDRKFYYDETSPSGIRWKMDTTACWKKVKAGSVAGSGRKHNGSLIYSVSVAGKQRLAHRVVWYLCTGNDPIGYMIDHINGDTGDNRISNLRKVTSAENNRNRKITKNHPTGFNGVNFNDNCYVATWCESMVGNQKYFSCMKYGKELALGLAIEYRHRMVTRQAEMGYGLSERQTGIYERPEVLKDITEDELISMFECNLKGNNSSGINGVHRSVSQGQAQWVYSNNTRNAKERKAFHCLKYGEDLAKSLVAEYASRRNNGECGPVDGFTLLETNAMLADETYSKNTSGIAGIDFRESRSGHIVYAQIGVKGKKYCKRFWLRDLGLLGAIAEAIRWRRSFSN